MKITVFREYGMPGLVKHWRVVFRYSAPFLAAAFPIIFFAASNRHEDEIFPGGQVVILELLGPITAICLAILVASLALRMWLKSIPLALVATMVLIVGFYGYGVIYNAFREYSIGEIEPIRHRTLLPSVLIVIVAALIVLKNRKWNWSLVLDGVTTGVGTLIVFNLALIVVPSGQDEAVMPGFVPDVEAAINKPLSNTAGSPDIYYLMFDGYASSDILYDYFGHDNGKFMTELNRRGFQFAPHSRANYIYTEYSLKSTFNMRHINDIPLPELKTFLRQHDGIRKRSTSIESTAVANIVEAMGYSVHAWTTSKHHGDNKLLDLLSVMFSPLSELVFDNTVMIVARERFEHLWHLGFGAHNFVENGPLILDVVGDPSPTFSYLYSSPPHPPYIFERDGKLKENMGPQRLGNIWVPRSGYVDQIVLVNSVILRTVDAILARTENEPIIIIQSDHGPSSTTGYVDLSEIASPSLELLLERSRILNTMYLPEICKEQLPFDLTAVNTFRFIFNSCFDADFALLPGYTYYTHGDGHQFDFKKVLP